MATILQQQTICYYNVTYPIMRVVDLYFWTKGFNKPKETKDAIEA